MRLHREISAAFLFGLVLCGGVARADESPDPTTDEVKTLVSKWIEIQKTAKPEMIKYHLADDFVAVNALGIAEDRNAFAARLASADIKIASLDSTEQSLRVHGTIVVITGIHKVEGTVDKRDISGTYRYVDVLRKVNNRWLAIASTLTRVSAN